MSPTNRDVDHRNEAELKKLNSAASCFKGSVSGNYKIDRLPSPLNLNLKIGAQVMFVKNNLDKKWINGTIGFVRGMNDNCINIEIAHTKKLVDVERVTWSEFKYLWNSETREIDREVTGSYHQFPLVLSWSMTIHKSQGRTIENVHLDLGSGSFETGQTYVALSRCRGMSGLSLNRPIMTSDIIVDEESKIFYNKLREIIKKLPPDELMKQFKD